tara:strand:- start:1 stop:141 length:141 start_codon:yes stop_codon:yes gene_type:complete
MKYADEKMGDEFYQWMQSCPVTYTRLKVNEHTIHYSFIAEWDEEEE